jgi:hypothetical protein
MRRDDFHRSSDEELRRDPAVEAHERRVANARLARSIASEQRLSGSSTNVTASRFRLDGYRPVVRRDAAKRLVIDWEAVGEGEG